MTSAGQLADARDLPEDPAGVEYRLTDEDAVLRALVHQHALAERIQVNIHDIADDEPVGDACGFVAQRTQALALGLQRLVALQAELGQAQLCLELALVGAQGIAGGDAFAKPVPALEGTGDGDLHGVGHDRQHAADLAEMIVALVDDDESLGRAANTARSGAEVPSCDRMCRCYERRPWASHLSLGFRVSWALVACITPIRICLDRVPR